jgi:hypothetical protein
MAALVQACPGHPRRPMAPQVQTQSAPDRLSNWARASRTTRMAETSPGTSPAMKGRRSARCPRGRPPPTSSPCVSGGDRHRFQFCIERFQSLRHLLLQLYNSCNFVISSGGAHGQPRARLLHLVGHSFRDHTISGHEFNVFNLLRRAISGRLHFRPSRAAIPATETPLFKVRRRPGDLRRDGAVRTNIERLPDSGKKFVERVVGLFELPSCAQFCRKVK